MALVTAFPCLARNCGVRQRVSALPLMQTHGGPFLSWPTTGLDAQQTLMEHSLSPPLQHASSLAAGRSQRSCLLSDITVIAPESTECHKYTFSGFAAMPRCLESLTTALQCYPKGHSNLFQRTTRHRLFSLDLQKIFSVPRRLVSWGGCNGEKSSFHKSDFSQEIILYLETFLGEWNWTAEIKRRHWGWMILESGKQVV